MNAEEAALLGLLRQELEKVLRRGAGRLEGVLSSPELESFVENFAKEMRCELSSVHSYGDRPNFIQSEAAERTYFKLRDLWRETEVRRQERGALRALAGVARGLGLVTLRALGEKVGEKAILFRKAHRG